MRYFSLLIKYCVPGFCEPSCVNNNCWQPIPTNSTLVFESRASRYMNNQRSLIRKSNPCHIHKATHKKSNKNQNALARGETDRCLTQNTRDSLDSQNYVCSCGYLDKEKNVKEKLKHVGLETGFISKATA